MRRIAVVMIAAMTLLMAGCGSGESEEGASPDDGCTKDWPRRVTLTGELASFAAACSTDNSLGMRLENKSPAVLQVTNEGSARVEWRVTRPTGSLTAQALNETVPDYVPNAALLVPGASLVATSADHVHLKFTIVPRASTLAYGSNILAKWAEGHLRRVLQTPGQRLYFQIDACVRAAYQSIRTFGYQNDEAAMVQLVEIIPKCRSLFKLVNDIVGDPSPPPPATIANELVKIGQQARSELFDDALRLGTRAAALVVQAK
jgi:hypothetical protein